jgi:HPt (histidine-containing phosphotransfer) domain-containing protein
MDACPGPLSECVAIDRVRMDSLSAGDDALAIDLVRMLLEEASPIVVTIATHVRDRNLPEVNALAHALKGIAGSVGALELCDAALHLEGTSAAKQTAAPAKLAAESALVSIALEHIRATLQCWQSRAAAHTGIFL